MASPFRYWAFISYSSKDRIWGEWLRQRLENYTIPHDLRGHQFEDGAVLGKHLRPIFRDRDELPGSDDLSGKIKENLKSSRYLVVLCSPNSAKSKWVNKEILDFQAMGRGKRILALIISGEPNSGDPATECFPPALRLPLEPIAGDLRKEGDGKERGFIKILAGIAELDFDKLYRRHERAARRARRIWASVAVVLIVTFAALAAVAWQQSVIARERLEQVQKESYVSGLRASAALIAAGKRDAAREILIRLPKSERRWEWGALMENCGAPAWKFTADAGAAQVYHPHTAISKELHPLVSGLAKAAAEKSTAGMVRVINPDDSPLATVYDRSGTRHGAYLAVVKKKPEANYAEMEPAELAHSKNAEVTFSLWAGNYDSIAAAQMSPDGSLLLVEGGYTAFSPSPTLDVSPSAAAADPESTPVYAIPLPPVEPAAAEAKEGPHRNDWQTMRFAELEPEIRKAVAKLEQYNEAEETVARRFADYYRKPDGSVLLLFNTWKKKWAGEVIAYPSGDLVATLGRAVDGGNNADMMIRDIGGAFSLGGTKVVLCPSGMPAAPAADEEAPLGTGAVFEVATGRHVATMARGGSYEYGRVADPVWGFSPDDRWVFQSSMEAATTVNVIMVCEAETGKAIENLTSDLRFLGWNPEGSHLYYVRGNSTTIEVMESSSLKKIGQIDNAVNSSAYPLFTQMRVIGDGKGERFALGEFVFSRNDLINPLVRLPKPPTGSILHSWLQQSISSDDPPSGTTAGRALWYWVRMSDRVPH